MDGREDEHNTQGVPDGDLGADTASGGPPDGGGDVDVDDVTTDDEGRPVDNPSGG